MTKRIMLDLETLSSKPNAAIVSIGAVEFGPEGLGREFYEVVARGEQVGYGRDISASTVEWWMGQGDEARAVFRAKTVEPDLALSRFSAFCETSRIVESRLFNQGVGPMELWSYGANFDEPVLGGLYDALGIKRPWIYREVRCHRTLLALGTEMKIALPARAGVHHNALDDAKYQAQCAVVILNHMGVK